MSGSDSRRNRNEWQIDILISSTMRGEDSLVLVLLFDSLSPFLARKASHLGLPLGPPAWASRLGGVHGKGPGHGANTGCDPTRLDQKEGID